MPQHTRILYIDTPVLRKLWKLYRGELGDSVGLGKAQIEELRDYIHAQRENQTLVMMSSSFAIMEMMNLARRWHYTRTRFDAGHDLLEIVDDWSNEDKRWKFLPGSSEKLIAQVREDLNHWMTDEADALIDILDFSGVSIPRYEAVTNRELVRFAAFLNLRTRIESQDCLHLSYAFAHAEGIISTDLQLVNFLRSISQPNWKLIGQGYEEVFGSKLPFNRGEFAAFHLPTHPLRQIEFWKNRR
jgi:hypothetical protein